jgi:hypothetical protein
MKLERFDENPILEPEPQHWWESKAVFNPGTLKCYAFALFDEEYSPIEVRFLLRRYAGTHDGKVLADTIRKYHHIWKLKQAQLASQPEAASV